MPREVVQEFSGTPMTERECFARMIDHLNAAMNCARGLAQLRRDMKWLIAVRNLEHIQDQVRQEIHKGGAPVLWLPERAN